MIFNVPTGKKSSVAVSIYGAPNERVTLINKRGVTCLNVTLDEHGISTGTYEVPVGKYTVKGSTSSEILSKGKIVEVNRNNTIITAYPDGAIFWFGNGDKEGDSLYIGEFTFEKGHYPSNILKQQYAGYAAVESTDKNIGILSRCPSTAGSRYASTLYSPKSDLRGYSYVNFYAASNYISQVAFGFPSIQNTKWESDMYITPTTTDYEIYSMAISSVQTDGYFAISTFNVKHGSTMSSVSVKAIWRDTTNDYSLESLREVTETIEIVDTYRYGTLVSTGFVKLRNLAWSLRSENYVGVGNNHIQYDMPYDYNATMISFPAVDFSGTSRRIKLALSLYLSPGSNHTFRWAISTSREHEDVYKGKWIVQEPNQLASGTFTAGANNTFLFECDSIPPSTPLYIYLWRDNNSYGNVHVQNKVVASLIYTEE